MASESDETRIDDAGKENILAKNENGIPTVDQQLNGVGPVPSRKASDTNASFLRAARAGNIDKIITYIDSGVDINASNANGLNALHLAAKEGHCKLVQELLQRGAAVDAATKKGNTALHIASLAGQLSVVKLLTERGSKVNLQSQNGFTALYMAAQENHVEVVRYLLTSNANQTLTTEDGFTPLAVALQQGHDKVVKLLLENDSGGKIHLPALHIAAKKDDVKAANLLLQNAHNVDIASGFSLANETTKSGFTPLHIAAHYGNVNVANLLIQKGADVNFKAKNAIMPLHVASKWGRCEMIQVLLDAGAVIDCQTRDGLTPLHCAARSGHHQVVDLLLDKDAPVTAKTKNGLSPLHMSVQGDHIDCSRLLLLRHAAINDVTIDYLTPLHVAAHCGNVKSAKLLLDRKCEVNARALNGFTPLHIACKKNRIKVVELLLKYGATIEATTESGLTPMHVAAFMGHLNIVLFFIQHGACIESTTVRGETALHLAARANQTDVMRILIRNGAQVDAKARELQTPLHIAARLGNVDNVLLLLQHGASPDATTKDLYTALHIAAKEGHEEVILALLEHGANHSLTTKKGFTALHIASKYGHLRTARLLLKRGADVNVEGRNGLTPLHVATHYGHIVVALMLMENGANPCCCAKNGYTPLHISAKKNQMDIAPTLFEYGAKPNADSKNGFTPLHLSAQNGHVDMASLLLERGAEVNWRAKNGLTPLHLAAQEDGVAIAEILVKHGVNVDSHTKAGYTPLHTACHFGQINMIRYLLDHSAKINAKTKMDYTPLHHAAQQGHLLVVNLLLKYGASPDALTTSGQTAMSIAERLGYLSVVEMLRPVTAVTVAPSANGEEKYRVISPEIMQEAPMSDSDDEGAENIVEPSDQLFQYLSSGEMKILQDDSIAIAKGDRDMYSMETRERKNSDVSSPHLVVGSGAIRDELKYMNDDSEIVKEGMIVCESVVKQQCAVSNASSPFVFEDDTDHHCSAQSFLISFMIDARGGALCGCRHGGVRVIVPPGQIMMPTRITCKLVRKDRLMYPPPLMDGEALASRVLEMGPVGARLLGPIIIEVPHFASLRGEEREIAILRSDDGHAWREHELKITDDNMHELIDSCHEDLKLSSSQQSSTMARIVTSDFPLYFAVVTRARQDKAVIGPIGGVVSSKVVSQVQAVFPKDAVIRNTNVALQVVPVSPELVSRLLGSNRVAVSPLVTLEPRRRKFHQPVILNIPLPRAVQRGMINQYGTNSGSIDTTNLRLLCSVFGTDTFAYLVGDSSTVDHSPNKYRAETGPSIQWEDITNSTPLTLVNDCVSFTTSISARFWLVDCQNVYDAVKMATELYQELVAVPFLSKFVVFAKREDVANAKVRLFCMTDDKMDKTLECQEQFTEIARSKDTEVLEDRPQHIEMSGNLLPVTKSGDPTYVMFQSFHENRLALSVKIRDLHQDPIGRVTFFREPRAVRGDPPQSAICNLNIRLPDVQELTKSGDTDCQDLLTHDERVEANSRIMLEADLSKTSLPLTYLDADEIGSSRELGSSRDSSMQRGVSLDVSYDDQDFIKESESAAEDTASEAGSVIEKDEYEKQPPAVIETVEQVRKDKAKTPVNELLERLKSDSDVQLNQEETLTPATDNLEAVTPCSEHSPALIDIARSDPLVPVDQPQHETEKTEKEDDTEADVSDQSVNEEWEVVDVAKIDRSVTVKGDASPSDDIMIPQSLPEPETGTEFFHVEDIELGNGREDRRQTEDEQEEEHPYVMTEPADSGKEEEEEEGQEEKGEEEASFSQQPATSSCGQLVIPLIDLQAASPLLQSPSSDDGCPRTSTTTVETAGQLNEDDSEELELEQTRSGGGEDVTGLSAAEIGDSGIAVSVGAETIEAGQLKEEFGDSNEQEYDEDIIDEADPQTSTVVEDSKDVQEDVSNGSRTDELVETAGETVVNDESVTFTDEIERREDGASDVAEDQTTEPSPIADTFVDHVDSYNAENADDDEDEELEQESDTCSMIEKDDTVKSPDGCRLEDVDTETVVKVESTPEKAARCAEIENKLRLWAETDDYDDSESLKQADEQDDTKPVDVSPDEVMSAEYVAEREETPHLYDDLQSEAREAVEEADVERSVRSTCRCDDSRLELLNKSDEQGLDRPELDSSEEPRKLILERAEVAEDDDLVNETRLSSITLGFDDDAEHAESRAPLHFEMLDPRSPEPVGGDGPYSGDFGDSSDRDDEKYPPQDNGKGRVTVMSPGCFMVESPIEQLSPSRELALKDELSPVTEFPPAGKRQRAINIGASPSGFILEEDEEDEELETATVAKPGNIKRDYFRPIVQTSSSEQFESDADDQHTDIERDDAREEQSADVRQQQQEDTVTVTHGDGEVGSDDEGTSSPFDVVTGDDLVGYNGDEGDNGESKRQDPEELNDSGSSCLPHE